MKNCNKSIIEAFLNSCNIPFISQPFTAEVPVIKNAELETEVGKIACIGSSIVSGEIPDGKYLISHLGYISNTPYNITYSPITDSICVVDHFKVPSVTIPRKDVAKITMAKEVRGFVNVQKKKVNTKNILVGNITNPKYIVFAHFDSIIGPGAVDNAGSVTVLMGCIADNKELLANTLAIFSGMEELAYDDYDLNGYGFRVFEKEYVQLLRGAAKIFVLDGIGVGDPSFSQASLDWVLQVRIVNEIRDKIFWLQNDQNIVLKYFHTFDDTAKILKEEYLLSAQKMLTQELFIYA